VALAIPAVLGATYVLDVPPGSSLRSRAAPAPAKALVIASDMSRQGFADGDNPTNTAIELYLKGIGNRVGDYGVTLRPYDVATSRWTRWDNDTCVKVATEQAARPEVVGVVGPYNSGCAKLVVPILNAAGGGPLAVVSNGATDPGLTKRWDAGEPEKYYPGGTRNFARVVTTDDVQGKAAASFARTDLGVAKVFVLNDGAVYGKHVARAFADAATAAGIAVVGEAQWKRGSTDYKPVLAKAKEAGADAVFLGGAVSNNGVQLVRDKVAVLGDNSAVKLLAADGFTGDTKLVALPEAQGMYLTFPGLSPASIRQRGGAGSEFLDAFQKQYGHDPDDPYAIYGVAAVQVLAAAIRRSDGTRAGVLAALFSGEGVTVPKAESVLGADTRIDPATGDVSNRDVTVQVVKRQAETFETVVTVP
jgi:branched-chain amino acid transport system substrate-binding protein